MSGLRGKYEEYFSQIILHLVSSERIISISRALSITILNPDSSGVAHDTDLNSSKLSASRSLFVR